MEDQKITLFHLRKLLFPKRSNSQDDFYQSILPLYMLEVFLPDDKSEGTRAKAIHGNKDGLAPHREVFYKLDKNSDEDFKSYEERLKESILFIQDFWTEILKKRKKTPQEIVLTSFLDDEMLQNADRIKPRLSSLITSPAKHLSALVALTFLSTTRSCWNQWNNKMIELILPEEKSSKETEEEQLFKDACNLIHEGKLTEAIEQLNHLRFGESILRGNALYQLSLCYEKLKRKDKAEYYRKEAFKLQNENAMLEYARNAANYHDYKKCSKICTDLINRNPRAKADTLGEAYYLLYKFSPSENDAASDYKNPEFYLKRSAEWGWPSALEEYKKKNKFSLIYKADPVQETTKGTFFFSVENELSTAVEHTAPSGWCKSGAKSLLDFIDHYLMPFENQKIFFLAPDQQQNFNQLLILLQSINEKSHSLKTEHWHLEIYIRGEEEQIGALVDTALNHLGNIIIPVYILDMDRQSAQKLLATHPLFYPVRDMTHDTKTPTTLNFVVLGSGKTCEWLVREAFYLLTTNRKSLTTKITILAPDAVQFLHRLYGLCPGLSSDTLLSGKNGRDKIAVKELLETFTVIDAGEENNVSFHTDAWLNRLNQIAEMGQAANEKYYFAIDIGSDLENLNLAIRLREWSIRRLILAGDRGNLTELPVIAFKCFDNNIAKLSRRMSVSLAEHGDAWYNNHAIISFGSLKERYNWEEINGGILEQMSYCIHMNYSGIPAEKQHEEKHKAAVQDARKSYYTRYYNRDSSYSVAISLPYRLWESNYPDAPNPVYPPAWNILDEDEFTSENRREYFCKILNGQPKYNREELEKVKLTLDGRISHSYYITNKNRKSYIDETERLAQWEQLRWCRWMISRGYLPSTFAQSETYMHDNGNRHQLYIARLHPCITSNTMLEILGKKIKKDFFAFNYSSIQMTEDFLSLKWLKIEKENVIRDEER